MYICPVSVFSIPIEMSQRRFCHIGIFVGLLLTMTTTVYSFPMRNLDVKRFSADSLMQKARLFAPFYEQVIDDYQAELYIKGKVNIRKKNHLLRFLPTMFRIRKNVREYLIETNNELHFTAPDIYDQKVKASMGTCSEFWEMDGRLPEYFHINIYSPSLLYNKLLSPLSPDAAKYYVYQVDSVSESSNGLQYRILFHPKYQSFQLLSGYLILSEDVWSIREIKFSGRSEMLRFENHMRMGEIGEADEFLPVNYHIDATFFFLGNEIDGSYDAVLNYKSITQRDPAEQLRKTKRSKYDLSESYTLSCDTNTCIRDTVQFASMRPFPLTTSEKQLYTDFFQQLDTTLSSRKKTNKRLEFWGEVGDALISRYTVDLSKMGSIRCSPLINPFLLSYSGKNGLSYKQEFKYNRLFAGDRLLRIVPKIGYNFKQKELYWSVNANFNYWPRKRSAIHFSVGNGNRIYSSEILNELKSIPDSVFDFSQIHLDYFKNLYMKLYHSWEAVNGLSLDVGIVTHRRTEVNRSRLIFLGSPSALSPQTGELVSSTILRLRHTYNSFSPSVRLKWTPGQYYYMNGHRKVNLHSRYPSIEIDWERGLKGVFNSSGNYERIELDVQHSIPVGLLRKLYVRAGWGAFTNQKEMYFVDFANFTRSNIPVGWGDEIGGVFHLLDGPWYNSSRNYLRAHITYESPFLIMHSVNKLTRHVLNERLYASLLRVPHLNPYLELGYGIGTHLFDFGVFGGFANGKFKEVGCKFTFELFNR